MINTLDQIEDHTLKSSQLCSCLSHTLNAHIPILNLHACASIDHHEDVDISFKQVKCRLLHANVRFTAVEHHCVLGERAEMLIHLGSEHAELLFALEDAHA